MRKDRGFTLIELLIVVAIIGIIAAIAIPNLLNAINRGRQKRTMADMRTIATAIEAYAVDNSFYPRNVSTSGGMEDHISPTYLKNMPNNDGWRNPFLFTSDANGATYTIQSTGRDAADNGCTANTVTQDFDCDICYSAGSFVQFPEGIQTE
jgi:general secretion pathway protein G